jgi:hypothetical protein
MPGQHDLWCDVHPQDIVNKYSKAIEKRKRIKERKEKMDNELERRRLQEVCSNPSRRLARTSNLTSSIDHAGPSSEDRIMAPVE